MDWKERAALEARMLWWCFVWAASALFALIALSVSLGLKCVGLRLVEAKERSDAEILALEAAAAPTTQETP